MGQTSIYHIENGKCYILVEEESVGREKQNLKLAIKIARGKIKEIKEKMDLLDEDSISRHVLSGKYCHLTIKHPAIDWVK